MREQIYSLSPLTTRPSAQTTLTRIRNLYTYTPCSDPRFFKSHLSESNQRPTDYKSVALPAELKWRFCLTQTLKELPPGLPPAQFFGKAKVSEIVKFISRETILSKLNILKDSLIRDFGIDKPRIAVLGLNPHAGDEGLIGREEEETIKPAIKDAKHNMLVFGPYSADAFFARNQQTKFDAVLAMYHDQGLIPFKSLAFGEGINFTAGLPAVRTSPDHGTAFDIAGKNKADAGSFLAAVYGCLDIIQRRREFTENHKNPLKKMGSVVLAGAEDEKIDEG